MPRYNYNILITYKYNDTTTFITFFTTAKLAGCDWCKIKVTSVVVLVSNIALITIGHLNKLCL